VHLKGAFGPLWAHRLEERNKLIRCEIVEGP